jgi:hypothetical protein
MTMTTGGNDNAIHIRGENAHGCLEPFRWDPEAPMTCTASVPADRMDELTEFLASLGAPAESTLQIMAVSREDWGTTRFTGEDIPTLVEKINNHLSGRNLHPLVPGDHEEWSVGRRHALLTMAAHHFPWADSKTEPFFWDEISPQGWRVIAKEYPTVFRDETS